MTREELMRLMFPKSMEWRIKRLLETVRDISLWPFEANKNFIDNVNESKKK